MELLYEHSDDGFDGYTSGGKVNALQRLAHWQRSLAERAAYLNVHPRMRLCRVSEVVVPDDPPILGVVDLVLIHGLLDLQPRTALVRL